ncbi:MAG: Trk system potassium transporter TrkA [Clostridia bacterium]|nr:Trk system potassium transporter TrkA [Clostridia bacterium]
MVMPYVEREDEGMDIVIVGGGKVGYALAAQLINEGHAITLIDKNERVIEQIGTTLDAMCIAGNGAAYPVLESAGVANADLLIAVTAGDEANMLCCLTAHRLGARHTIARVRNPEYYAQLSFLKEDLGLSMAVNPELAAAEEIARILRFPTATKVELFARGRVELVSYHVNEDSVLCGMQLSELPKKTGIRVLICAVEREEAVVIPSGDYVIHADDELYMTGAPQELERMFRKLHLLVNRAANVLIMGGGRITYYLAERLAREKVNVKVIERETARANELAVALPKAVVLCGDASDHEVLMEEGLEKQDAFVALTGLDEGNILTAIYAHRHKVPKVIAKVNNEGLFSLIKNSGLDSIISPKLITANQILRFVRALTAGQGIDDVLTLYQILGGRVEVLEFRAAEDAPYCGIPLKDLPIRRNILIASLVRSGRAVIPGGGDCIRPGDGVLVVTAGRRLHELSDILESV